MRSPRHIGAGDVNMRGKKTRAMRCGCCVCLDFREAHKALVDKKEMREAKRGDVDPSTPTGSAEGA